MPANPPPPASPNRVPSRAVRYLRILPAVAGVLLFLTPLVRPMPPETGRTMAAAGLLLMSISYTMQIVSTFRLYMEHRASIPNPNFAFASEVVRWFASVFLFLGLYLALFFDFAKDARGTTQGILVVWAVGLVASGWMRRRAFRR